MITAFLAGSGSRVVIPDAIDIIDGDSEDEVKFVDADGRVLVAFKRADVSLYSHDGTGPALPLQPGERKD